MKNNTSCARFLHFNLSFIVINKRYYYEKSRTLKLQCLQNCDRVFNFIVPSQEHCFDVLCYFDTKITQQRNHNKIPASASCLNECFAPKNFLKLDVM